MTQQLLAKPKESITKLMETQVYNWQNMKLPTKNPTTFK